MKEQRRKGDFPSGGRMLRYAWHAAAGQLRQRIRERKVARTLLQSGLFDAEFYLSANPDVRKANVDPLLHFIHSGAMGNRNPHPLFDVSYYLQSNPDVCASEINPLLHYVSSGCREARNPHPLFDSAYYLKQNPDVEADGFNPLWHYCAKGAAEGRDPHPYFNSSFYLEYRGPLQQGKNPLIDYLEQGPEQSCDPHPFFDTAEYLRRYPEIVEKKINPLLHCMLSKNVAFFQANKTYRRWRRLYGQIKNEDRRKIEENISEFPRKPLFSLIVLDGDSDSNSLIRTVTSVKDQLYPNWELLIQGGGLQNEEALEQLCHEDERRRFCDVKHAATEGEALSEIFDKTNGEYIAILEPGVELAPHALYLACCKLIEHPAVDFIYSDEEARNGGIDMHEPCFKPDWNPDLLLSQNYIGSFWICRSSVLKSALPSSRVSIAALLWELALSCTEKLGTSKIQHLPFVLALRDSSPRLPNVSGSLEFKHVLEAACAGRGIKGDVVFDGRTRWRIKRRLETEPLVTIIIPTKDRRNLLEPCISTLLTRTGYKNYEILIVDNDSTDRDALEYLSGLEKMENVRVLRYPGGFNYSAINNFAVNEAKGELIALLNNDVEIIDGTWLEEMASHAVRPEIGAVGAKLLYPDGTIQHAGVICGMRGGASHCFAGLPSECDDSGGRANAAQNYSAVTAACMLLRKELYLDCGGLDEANLPIAFNDTDLCLKLQAKGYRNLYTPCATLLHKESASRGLDDFSLENHARSLAEANYLKERWPDVFDHDPAYNLNHAMHGEPFELSFPPRVQPPWKERNDRRFE